MATVPVADNPAGSGRTRTDYRIATGAAHYFPWCPRIIKTAYCGPPRWQINVTPIMDEKLQVDLLRRELEFRQGAGNAITIDVLGQHLGHSSRRETEQALELHIGALPFCVVSGASGYFRPSGAEDINHYCNSLRSRIKCLAIRHRTVIRAARQEGFQREGKRFVNAATQTELFKEVIKGRAGQPVPPSLA